METETKKKKKQVMEMIHKCFFGGDEDFFYLHTL